MTICEEEKCTGCGSCVAICPKKCISLVENNIGTLLPNINDNECVGCGLCKKVCHVNMMIYPELPRKAWAACILNNEMRRKSASGGMGAAIYLYALKHKFCIMGTYMDINDGVSYRPVKNFDDISWARDSKYVYSSMADCFTYYEMAMVRKEKAIFIGLPCQIMSIKNYLKTKKINDDLLLYIEIICHGIPNWKMLKNHIDYIENTKKKTVDKVTFRGPNSQFDMRMWSAGKLIYMKPMHWDDEYYRAFSVGLIFRENCYNCKYARPERIADITIGDYSGLGDLEPWEGEKEQMSVVLGNSARGELFIEKLIKEGYIFAKERLVDEPINAKGNPQLRQPSKKHSNRDLFVVEYSTTGKFERAVRNSLQEEMIDYFRKREILAIKKFLHDKLPRELQKRIRKSMHRFRKLRNR